jgi:hypothetical protein
MANTFRRDRPEGPLRLKGTGPKGHYTEKKLLDDKYRPDRPISSKETGPKGHHVRTGPIATIFSLVWRLFKIIIFQNFNFPDFDFKILNVQYFDYSSICNSRF